jgi:hypothetical protein
MTVSDQDVVTWLGPHALMIFSWSGAKSGWLSHRIDIDSGKVSALKYSAPIGSDAYGFTASPDGRKVAWEVSLPEGPRFRVERADGSGGVTVAHDDVYYGEGFYWTPDSKTLIDIPPSGGASDYDTPPRLMTWNSERPGAKPDITDPETERWDSYAFRSLDDTRAASADSRNVISTVALSVRNPSLIHRIGSVHLPGHLPFGLRRGGIWVGGLAPDGTRLAAMIAMDEKEPLTVTLLRWLHIGVKWTPRTLQCIWVSSVTGSHGHEVAHITLPPDQLVFTHGMLLSKVDWSPDGKRLCCVYHQTLYVLDAE